MTTIINWLWPFFLLFTILLLSIERNIKKLDKTHQPLSSIPLFNLFAKFVSYFKLKSSRYLLYSIQIPRYAAFLIFFNFSFISFNMLISSASSDHSSHAITMSSIIYSHLITVAITISAYLLAMLLAKSKRLQLLLSFLACFPLLLFSPIAFLLVFFETKCLPAKKTNQSLKELLKNNLLNLLASPQYVNLESQKRKLLTSIAHFDEKMCREIMIPRIKVECLEDSSSILESIKLFVEEGYSRIPVYEKSIDHITGMLLYKDVLEYIFNKNLTEIEKTKDIPITSMVTPILYAPENKPISDLFQTMRKRKIHAAIIVNEYGCTEGLVTIEDIFEELIGSEILDEHDEDDFSYQKTHDKGWIIDADVSIIDAEREFGIKLPHNAEYETVGGFISTTMGVIPKVGTIVHHEKYRLKVLSSNERQILKIKISQFPQTQVK